MINIKTLLPPLFIILAVQSFAQNEAIKTPVVMTIENAKLIGLTIEKLDLSYPPAGGSDTSNVIFKKEEEFNTFFKSYCTMYEDFMAVLRENKMIYPKPIKAWFKNYFSKDGRFEYVLYVINDPKKDEFTSLSLTDKEKFQTLLIKFVQNYKLKNLSSNSPYAQCGGVSFVTDKVFKFH